MDNSYVRDRRDATRTALKISGGYGAVALAWIVITDALLGEYIGLTSRGLVLSELKGVLFVLVTATVLYFLVRRMLVLILEREIQIRSAYEDVLDAATGGKLALMTEEEIAASLGTPLGGLHVIETPKELADARAVIAAEVGDLIPPEGIGLSVLSPTGEALNNALRHAGRGGYQVFRRDGRVQVVISDEGPGIDFSALPRAVLMSGYSTSATLGVGFTLMLRLSSRVMLSTRPGRTVVVVECDPGLDSLTP